MTSERRPPPWCPLALGVKIQPSSNGGVYDMFRMLIHPKGDKLMMGQ